MGIPNFTTWQMVYFFVVITTIATLNFLRSPIGRSTLSVREDEIAAESVGVNTTKIKIIAFVFGAITASIAGSLQAGFIGSVCTERLHFHQLNQRIDHLLYLVDLVQLQVPLFQLLSLEF